jgi:probable F420-dependent oxidoreductase
MRIDASLNAANLDGVPERIRFLEESGYDAAMTAETGNDPFFPLVLAAEHSERIDLMTSIAVAFARNPMIVAHIGNDLNAYSKGRFILGLGSQIKPHINKRFSMPWDKPASRMREFILAMRAIWNSWYTGERLRFLGDFYTHSLMTPMFTPTNNAYGPPRVFLAAVGPMMTEVAGETADGVIAHAFTTEKYMREVTIPAVERGLEKAGRAREDFELSFPAFVVTGETEAARTAQRAAVCKQIAFYGSTPAYRPVLEVHGWGELQPELNSLSKQGKWDEMGDRITDDILDQFAVVAPPGEVVAAVNDRYGDMVDRVSLYFDFLPADQQRAAMAELQKA